MKKDVLYVCQEKRVFLENFSEFYLLVLKGGVREDGEKNEI